MPPEPMPDSVADTIQDRLLNQIVQKHAKNFESETSETEREMWVALVVREYLGLLRKKQITVPLILEPLVKDDLAACVRSMVLGNQEGNLSSQGSRSEEKKLKKKVI
jgi:hypothetical protein